MIGNNDPGSWAQTTEGRVLLVMMVIIGVVVMAITGFQPNTGGHYEGGSGSSHKGGHYETQRREITTVTIGRRSYLFISFRQINPPS